MSGNWQAVERAAEEACMVVERVLNADAWEGTPIWEWSDYEAEAGVREVLAATDQLSAALDALTRRREADLPEYVGGQPFPADLWGTAPIRGAAVKLVEQFIENRATSGRDFTAGDIVDALIDAGLIDSSSGREKR